MKRLLDRNGLMQRQLIVNLYVMKVYFMANAQNLKGLDITRPLESQTSSQCISTQTVLILTQIPII